MAVRKGVDVSVTAGTAKVDLRTKNLIKRLRPGDVAVINHEDLDRVAAEGLVEARVGAVINAAASISGRYPNVGPLLVAAAGIPLIDRVGAEVMTAVREGQLVRVSDDGVYAGEVLLASGTRQTLQSLESEYEAAKVSLGDELERFAENTLEFMRRERHVWLDSPELPDLSVDLSGRHALIVVRGADYERDLDALRDYVHEMKPVVIAVDGGADALIDRGLRPDIIIGDFDSVSDRALQYGAQNVVHAYAGGDAPGAVRLDTLEVPYVTLAATGTSEDVAMLLAYEKGAELIVAVGTHSSMVDFLDKGRAGMASTFLARLKVGPILVDAKGVSQLYRSRIRKRDLTLFLLATVLCFAVVFVALTPSVFFESFWLIVRDQWRAITH